MSDSAAHITLRALISARWVLLGLLAATQVVEMALPDGLKPLLAWFPIPPHPSWVLIVLAFWSVANLATKRLVLDRGRASQRAAGVHLLVDAAALTTLLAVSGGPTNPFTTVYFVPITLATQVSPRWTWALAAMCLAGFASLFAVEPLPEPLEAGHGAHFSGHLRGLWIAFGVTGVLVTVFVHRIALSLAQSRLELTRLRDQAIQDRHFAALGTLAAGAAHELGTPLGTIQLLVGELPHMDEAERDRALATMREQVSRCKDIVGRMASPEPGVRSFGTHGGEPWTLSSLGKRLQAEADHEGVSLRVQLEGDLELRQPRESVEQIVRELISNAVDACAGCRDGSAWITLHLAELGGGALVEVRDEGEGMEPEVAVHAFEPFFSTKAEGEGMGMGLYLARAQVRQLGGQLELDSTPGDGTTLRLTLPAQPTSTRSA
ncbi:MAG: HAMP domain-containing histidine kinase [Myxococcales bacterium]|nr:HAMP domain-containing histidine kinase [Myxococcales bacterium]MCB9715893.1 HAMP domain-containing histidine kinase [Myxococcales bacterium]